MTLSSTLRTIARHEDLNFLLTNRIPRRAATRFMGWFSRIRQPLVRDLSIGAWKLFADLDLADAQQDRFDSLHDCFTRRLRPGARPASTDPSLLCSPCDGLIGASGQLDGRTVLQAKGYPYSIDELFGDPGLAAPFEGGQYVTLRLTSGMYHHLHAPHDWTVERLHYFSGDTWNVNPIALARVERLFCKNERSLLLGRLDAGGWPLAVVPVAAILVASIRLTFADTLRTVREQRPWRQPCAARMRKGDPMGWFEHGSTVIVFAPPGFRLCARWAPGARIQAGQPLMSLP